MTWDPGLSTFAGNVSDGRESESLAGRWSDVAESMQLQGVGRTAKKAVVYDERASSQVHREEPAGGEQFISGRKKQWNFLRNELYGQILAVKTELEIIDKDWKDELEYMLKAFEKLPLASPGGSVFVCEDGEMGVVWEDEDRRVEIGVMPSAGMVEYLVWDIRGDVSTEKEWDVKGGEEIPDIIKSALEKMPGR